MINIKLLDIIIKNFKNIKYGEISFNEKNKISENDKGKLEFSENIQTNMIGIYGQNGSGKTSVIEAIRLLKLMMSGESLKNKSSYHNYIYQGEDTAELSFTFFYKNNHSKYLINYSFKLMKKYNQYRNYNYVQICSEAIKYKEIKKDAKEKPLISWNNSEDQDDFTVLPSKFYEEIISIRDNEVNIKVAKAYSQEQRSSFLFSKKFLIFMQKYDSNHFLNDILNILSNYAKFAMFVIRVKDLGVINADFFIPFFFSIGVDAPDGSTSFSGGVISMHLNSKSKMQERHLKKINILFEQLNRVLPHIIPDLQIYIRDLYNDEIDKNNNILKNVTLIAKYPDYEIPLKYESNGIIKIISILGSLIAVYNNENFFLAVDELDSGIFEYMLGELLALLEGRIEGQLLFTSHNLRILELINNKSIRFATTNPENKFGIIKNVKQNNNLRDIYLRYVTIGEENNRFYSETDKYEIAYALQQTGNVIKQPDISRYVDLVAEEQIGVAEEENDEE